VEEERKNALEVAQEEAKAPQEGTEAQSRRAVSLPICRDLAKSICKTSHAHAPQGAGRAKLF
jgi:hypothetical protein